MLRKIIVLFSLLLLLPLVTQAHEANAHQPPIIAMDRKDIYAVSPVDGSAVKIVDRADDEVLSRLWSDALSPDGKWLVYGKVRIVTEPNRNVTHLYLMNLEDYSAVELLATGGVFNRPVPARHAIQTYLPTWSFDGSRLYYFRIEKDASDKGRVVNRQLVYFTPADGKFHLAGRIPLDQEVQALIPTAQGMVVESYERTTGVDFYHIYAPNNALTTRQFDQPLSYEVVHYEGRVYYIHQNVTGDIESIVDVETDDITTFTEKLYISTVSRYMPEQSVGIYSLAERRGTYYRIFAGAESMAVDNPHGVRYALAPDGQAIAFVQYDKEMKGFIQIADSSLNVRELPFEATQLIWGSQINGIHNPPSRG